MAIALYRKSIHCPQCKYEGAAKLKGSGLGIPGFVCLVIGIFFWPLLIPAAILLLCALIWPAKQICPKCNWANPVSLSQRRKEAYLERECPQCAETVHVKAKACRFCGYDLSGSLPTNKADSGDLSSVLGYQAGKLFGKKKR